VGHSRGRVSSARGIRACPMGQAVPASRDGPAAAGRGLRSLLPHTVNREVVT